MAKVSACAALGLDTAEMRHEIQRARTRAGVGDTAGAVAALAAVEARAQALGTLHRQASETLQETAQRIEEARAGGVDVRGFLEGFARAREAFTHADFGEALAIASRVRADLEEL